MFLAFGLSVHCHLVTDRQLGQVYFGLQRVSLAIVEPDLMCIWIDAGDAAADMRPSPSRRRYGQRTQEQWNHEFLHVCLLCLGSMRKRCPPDRYPKVAREPRWNRI